MNYGHFDDAQREFVVTNPLTPRPWINYLGNRRLTAFISQNAGGLLWYLEPQSRRLTRYHYLATPADQPGFYVYLRDRQTGAVWNPHFAPTGTPLTRFECRHAPGCTRFLATCGTIAAELAFGIPPEDDVMLWRLRLTNHGARPATVQAVSYLEFGLFEFLREVIGWCYLKSHIAFRYDRERRAIAYDYHVFEAPYTPRVLFGCTAPVSGFDCARDAFVGRGGSLARPAALQPEQDLGNSELPLGGHGCGALAADLELAPGTPRQVNWVLAVADQWPDARALLAHYGNDAAVDLAFESIYAHRHQRLSVFAAQTGDTAVDRFVSTWNPANALVTLELARIISTDHMGTDGLRYRDTTQDALAVASLDPEFARARLRQVFATQGRDGSGCFAFYPYNRQPLALKPDRSDNTVWQIDPVLAVTAESGKLDWLGETIPFRDGGKATVYKHVLLGLKYIYGRRGPHGLPRLCDCDWNDGLALFGDPQAESVMLAMQMVHACNALRGLAERLGHASDAAWCAAAAYELTAACNSDAVWDGQWYRRLLLSNGKIVGGAANRQGRLFLNPQSWAVISGVGERDGRGKQAMAAAAAQLNSLCGLCLLAPPYRGFPEPEDPPLGSTPGSNENGSIFCHANTWAIIAAALLGDAELAWQFYRQLLPEALAGRVGAERYQREPYACVSSVVGPASERFGEGGISWLTGTASWLYVAATQYLLGVRPTLDGLCLAPCLPRDLPRVQVERRFRGCVYRIEFLNEGRAAPLVELNGKPLAGTLIPPQRTPVCRVRCRC